jgi:hypothetical protein
MAGDSSHERAMARQWLRLGKPERALIWAREAYQIKRSAINAALIREAKSKIHPIDPRTTIAEPALPVAPELPPEPEVELLPVLPRPQSAIESPRPVPKAIRLRVFAFLIGVALMAISAGAVIGQALRKSRAAGIDTVVKPSIMPMTPPRPARTHPSDPTSVAIRQPEARNRR